MSSRSLSSRVCNDDDAAGRLGPTAAHVVFDDDGAVLRAERNEEDDHAAGGSSYVRARRSTSRVTSAAVAVIAFGQNKEGMDEQRIWES